jgi:hypothetical protein
MPTPRTKNSRNYETVIGLGNKTPDGDPDDRFDAKRKVVNDLQWPIAYCIERTASTIAFC